MLEIERASKAYFVPARWPKCARTVQALSAVSLSVSEGEFVGLVGGSGSGKTTLGRCILGIEALTGGAIRFEGRILQGLPGREMLGVWARMQMVFQDPFASLNPRMTVREIVSEPLEIHARALRLDRRGREARVTEMLGRVGLGAQFLSRYPHEFSGGQRQRIGIARALMLRPRLLVLDEPTSALDVSVQATILNLLRTLQREMGLTVLLISHDLGVVRYVCSRVAVLERGVLVEDGPVADVFDHPRSDYARALLAAVPEVGRTAPIAHDPQPI